jgi:hypothetical protein
MTKINSLALFLVLPMLAACATQTQTTSVTRHTVAVEPPKQIAPAPDQLKLRTLDWKVLSVDEVPYFALDAENYKNYTLNNNDIRAYIQQVNVLMENK